MWGSHVGDYEAVSWDMNAVYVLWVSLQWTQYLSYSKPNERMTDEWWIGREMQGSSHGVVEVGLLCWQFPGMTEENLSSRSRYPGRDSSRAPHEYLSRYVHIPVNQLVRWRRAFWWVGTWWWLHHIPSKQYLSTKVQDVRSQITVILKPGLIQMGIKIYLLNENTYTSKRENNYMRSFLLLSSRLRFIQHSFQFLAVTPTLRRWLSTTTSCSSLNFPLISRPTYVNIREGHPCVSRSLTLAFHASHVSTV
jgi:hypothetical protein